MRALGVIVLACVWMAGACSKSSEEKKHQGLPPAESWQTPGGSDGGANPHAGMANPHGGANPHAGMANPHGGAANPHGGGTDVTQLGLQPPDPERAIDSDKFLKGTMKPTGETKARIPPGSVIFLSVKRADPTTGQPTGAPLAVQRLQLATWPLWFQLTEADAMVSGTAFEGDVVITAWSDQDQDAISKQPGDVRGEVRAKIPSDGLELVLDTVIP